MDSKRLPQTCTWAEPTLYQPWPMWLDAWAWPWRLLEQALKTTNAKTAIEAYDQNDAALGELS